MNLEDELLNLLILTPNSKEIERISEKLEKGSNFLLSENLQGLLGVWELRWSSSNSPFLKYSPLIDNLQILDPNNLNGLNLLKPKGLNSIIGTGIVIKITKINEKRIGVKFTHAGFIGPMFRRKKLKALTKIKNEQKGWLEITYLSAKLRICRGDKGTLFVLKRLNKPSLFNKYKEFINHL